MRDLRVHRRAFGYSASEAWGILLHLLQTTMFRGDRQAVQRSAGIR